MTKNAKLRKAVCLWGFLFFFVCTGSGLTQGSEQEFKPPELPRESLKGRFEFDIHYSSWSMNLIKSWFEDELNKRFAEEIRDEVTRQVRLNHPFIYDTALDQDLSFDSYGHNMGLEFRYYPQGKGSAFSLGFSLEENVMKLQIQGSFRQEFTNGTYAEASTEGFVVFKPILTHFSFRWDLIPGWIVSPYFVMGFGFGSMRGEISYNYQSVYSWSGSPEDYSDDIQKTLKEAEEDIEYNLPNIFPLFQLGFGLRAKILPFLDLKAEAAFWNGFILKAAAAVRF